VLLPIPVPNYTAEDSWGEKLTQGCNAAVFDQKSHPQPLDHKSSQAHHCVHNMLANICIVDAKLLVLLRFSKSCKRTVSDGFIKKSADSDSASDSRRRHYKLIYTGRRAQCLSTGRRQMRRWCTSQAIVPGRHRRNATTGWHAATRCPDGRRLYRFR